MSIISQNPFNVNLRNRSNLRDDLDQDHGSEGWVPMNRSLTGAIADPAVLRPRPKPIRGLLVEYTTFLFRFAS